MKDIRIAVVQFPGSNTERETHLALCRVGMTPVDFLWNQDHGILEACDGFVLVGGFSYEDCSRSGVIASLDPVLECLKDENERGKPILGICNGAQILVESGMIPQLDRYQVGLALTRNKRVSNGRVLGTGYYNAWVNLKLNSVPSRCAFTRDLEPEGQLKIPAAHGEGRFLAPQDLISELAERDQITFQYCDRSGTVSPGFPVNPNGSDANIAAVCNPSGNVMAMMPHPERTPNGDSIFSSMRDYILNPSKIAVRPLTFTPRPAEIQPFEAAGETIVLTVKLLIADNEAVAVENTLRRLGIPVKVERHTHWEIVSNGKPNPELLREIEATGELFNPNKEAVVILTTEKWVRSYLVRPKEDWIGRQKLDALKKRFGLENLLEIRHGVLWRITSSEGADGSLTRRALQTNIFYNAISHNCHEYS